MSGVGWMSLRPSLLSSDERSVLRSLIRRSDTVPRGSIELVAEIAGWANARWPGYYVRFERGGACIRSGRAVTVSTAPMYAMAIHNDGTVHYLALDPGNRHDIDREPCGMYFRLGRAVPVTAWAGGEGRPRRDLKFSASRWGRVLWIVEIGRDGQRIVWPDPVQQPGAPPDPEPPDEDEDRSWYDRAIEFLKRLWHSIEKRI